MRGATALRAALLPLLAAPGAAGTTITIDPSCEPSHHSQHCAATLAAAAALPCAPPCTLAFAGAAALGPQSAFGLTGTAESPVVITSRGPGLSGAGVPEGGQGQQGRPYDALLSLRNCSHVVVRSLSLSDAKQCNGSNLAIDPHGDWFPGRGLCGSAIAIWEGQHVTVENVSVARVWNYGWAGSGSYLTVRDSRFADLQLCNANATGDCQRALHGGEPHPGTGWGQGLATAVRGSTCGGVRPTARPHPSSLDVTSACPLLPWPTKLTPCVVRPPPAR